MSDALRHRGPDGEGFHAEGPVALGHRRLAIIDLEGGAQPVFNEDRTIAVVFNGEIYNYRELAQELRPRHTLRTASDTEVLVHLYEDLGVEMLRSLRGMFAFAIWDGRRKRLFAARDRLGKKPMVYKYASGELWLASEISALQAAGVSPGAVDRVALARYLQLLYIPSPATIWSGVRKVPPGHYLVADEGRLEINPYWHCPLPGSAVEVPPGVADRTLRILQQSTKLRLRSDVPVGVLLSGGIDSSVVTTLAAEASTTKLKTFSVGFGRADDELPRARKLANHLGTEHHEITINENVSDVTRRALAAFSEPFGDSSSVPCSEVFREVAKHVKVVLTGDGGDELFAGYGRYRLAQSMPEIRWALAAARMLAPATGIPLIRRARRAAAILGTTGFARACALMEVFSERERRRLLGSEGAPMTGGYKSLSNADAAIAFDLDIYLPDDLLVKTDITSMASSVEARCPLLDQSLVEEVVPLPTAAKQDAARGKLLLQEAMRGRVPEAVFNGPKRGFGSPVDQWLRGPLRDMFGDLVLSRHAQIRGWLDGREVDIVARGVLGGTGNSHQGWALMALEAWAEKFARQKRV